MLMKMARYGFIKGKMNMVLIIGVVVIENFFIFVVNLKIVSVIKGRNNFLITTKNLRLWNVKLVTQW